MKSKAKVRDGNSTHDEISSRMEAGEQRGKNEAKMVVARKGILLPLKDFREFLSPSKNFIWSYIKGMLLFVIVPATGVAIFLYQVIPEKDLAVDDASTAWWILFLFVRQPITLGLSKVAQLIVVEYCFQHTQLVPRLLGPYVTLLVVQSKGIIFQIARFLVGRKYCMVRSLCSFFEYYYMLL
jgi:hypothetical protein